MPALGGANRARGRKRTTPRQQEISRIGAGARNSRGHGPAQGGRLGAAGIPGLGAQLTRRVQSGAITRDQAQQTAKQRQTLKAAYGGDWRTKVFGDAGYAQRTRTALSKSPDDPQLTALNSSLMARRMKLLEAARAKLAGGSSRPTQAQPRRRRHGYAGD